MDLSTFFDQLPLGCYRLTPDARVLRINEAFAKLHGYADCEAFHKNVGQEPFNPYADPGQLAHFQSTLKSQGSACKHAAKWLRHGTGEVLWVRENAHMVCDSAQTPLYYEGTVEDISTEHCAMEELQHQETLLRHLLQAMPDQLWLKDLYGVYLTCNEKYACAVGSSISQIIGTVDADHPAAAMAAHYFVTDEAVIRLGKLVSYEVEIRSAAHCGYDTFEIIKVPLRASTGAAVGILGMARNISERKLSEMQLRHSSEHLELAMIGVELGRWDYHLLRERGYFMDARAWHLLGRPAEAHTKGLQFGELVHPDDLPETLRAMRAHLEGHGGTLHVEFRALHQNGNWVWLCCRGKVVQHGADGSPLRMSGSLMDISERKSAERKLRDIQAELQATLGALPDLLFEVSADGVFRSVHCMDPSLLVMSPDYLIGKSVHDVLPTDAARTYMDALGEATTTGRSQGHQYSLQLRDEQRWFELSIVKKPTDSDEEVRLIVIASDITARKELSDTTHHPALHDALTGLPNRRLLGERLQRAMLASERSKHYGALLFLDLDPFQQLNANHGHGVGDRLLQEAARRLQQTIRKVDSVARLDGDKFVIIVNDLGTERSKALALVEALGQKVLSQLRQTYQLDEVNFQATPNLGITLFHSDAQSFDTLLQQADSAMIQAKADGRNTLRVYDTI